MIEIYLSLCAKWIIFVVDAVDVDFVCFSHGICFSISVGRRINGFRLSKEKDIVLIDIVNFWVHPTLKF